MSKSTKPKTKPKKIRKRFVKAKAKTNPYFEPNIDWAYERVLMMLTRVKNGASIGDEIDHLMGSTLLDFGSAAAKLVLDEIEKQLR